MRQPWEQKGFGGARWKRKERFLAKQEALPKRKHGKTTFEVSPLKGWDEVKMKHETMRLFPRAIQLGGVNM